MPKYKSKTLNLKVTVEGKKRLGLGVQAFDKIKILKSTRERCAKVAVKDLSWSLCLKRNEDEATLFRKCATEKFSLGI